jgi:hypothetical protein
MSCRAFGEPDEAASSSPRNIAYLSTAADEVTRLLGATGAAVAIQPPSVGGRPRRMVWDVVRAFETGREKSKCRDFPITPAATAIERTSYLARVVCAIEVGTLLAT